MIYSDPLARWDTEDTPALRAGALCLCCIRGGETHFGWRCADVGISLTKFWDAHPSFRYETKSMRDSLPLALHLGFTINDAHMFFASGTPEAIAYAAKLAALRPPGTATIIRAWPAPKQVSVESASIAAESEELRFFSKGTSDTCRCGAPKPCDYHG